MAKSSSSHRRRAAASALILVLAAITCTIISSFPMLPNNIIVNPSRSHSFAAAGVQLHSSPNADNESASSGVSSSSSRRNRRKKPHITDKNLYNILGANPAMSRTEIKRLYITLAKETHPDSSTINHGGIANDDRFNEIAQAWTIISDTKTRRAYDRELAAQDFKDDVIKKAGEVAREYGPTARKFYEEFAIPMLRRTTATTLAGWSAVTEAASTEVASSERETRNGELNNKDKLSGATLSEVVKEVSEMERVNAGADALQDFGRAFQRVIEAGKNATRQIDGVELQEKSMDLRRRADESRAESMEVLGRLTEIKSERLRLTFHTSSANFTSTDAIHYLDGFSNQGISSDDEVTLMQRMTFKHTVLQDIEAFTVAETEFDERMMEKTEVEQQMMGRQRELQEAERNARSALEAEERARKMLEDAQRQVAESQNMVSNAQKSIRDLDTTVRKADQDLSKASTILKRKRDVVRRELKRKADKVEGNIFDQVDNNGKVRLNPGFDRSSMNAMGFETQSIATIDALRKDEQRVEADFLRLVEKASRLVSRSERLKLKSDELIGKQRMEANNNALTNNQGVAVEDTFEGVSDEMMEAAQISNTARQNARLDSQ